MYYRCFILHTSGGSARDAAIAAMAGVEATKSMESSAGRSNYVAAATMQGTPDPGAFAVAAALEVIGGATNS
jgi:triose/dihydroxyacetone kinase / FAD-AMP lyase (cyclizing)